MKTGKITGVFKMGPFTCRRKISGPVMDYRIRINKPVEFNPYEVGPTIEMVDMKVAVFSIGKRLSKRVWEYNFEKFI